MIKSEALDLYLNIKELKNGDMDKDTLYSFIQLRLKMKDLYKDFGNMKNEVLNQTKPKDFKEGDDRTIWNNSYKSIIIKWLEEKFEYHKVFTLEEALDYGHYNDIQGDILDFIVDKLVIQ